MLMLTTHFSACGKAFHSLGAATANAASPALPRVLGTTRELLVDERRQRVGWYEGRRSRRRYMSCTLSCLFTQMAMLLLKISRCLSYAAIRREAETIRISQTSIVVVMILLMIIIRCRLTNSPKKRRPCTH